MAPGLSELAYLIYLLPGFLIYAIVCRLLTLEKEKDTFETTFLSLFLSLLVYLPLSYFDSIKIISLDSPDWVLFLILVTIIVILSFFSILFVKYILLKLEKFTQRFDIVKSSTKDILSDVLYDKVINEEKLVKKYGIWLAICTAEDQIYTGYIKRQGLFNDNKKGIYLKDVVKISGNNKNININEFEGMLFLENQIKWVSLIKYNFKK